MRHLLKLLPLFLMLATTSLAYADDPVVNYVRVSVDSDTQMNCNDLNVEIGNVNRDIGLLESQDEQLQGIASQGAQTFVPQSTNAGNALELFSNTMGDAAVIDAENSLPAVEASLSTARARVGYLQTLEGSCGNNTGQQQQAQQQQAPPPHTDFDRSDPPRDRLINVTFCDKTDEDARVAVIRLSGNGSQWIAGGWIPLGAHHCNTRTWRRGKIWFFAEAIDANGKTDTTWSGSERGFCVTSDQFDQQNIEPPCPAGEWDTGSAAYRDLSDKSDWTENLTVATHPHSGGGHTKRKR